MLKYILSYIYDNTVKLSIVESVESGDIDSVIDCVENGLDINSRDNNNRSILMISALKGYDDIFALLIKEGADTTTRDSRGDPLVYYVKNNYKLLSSIPIDDVDYVDIEGRCISHWGCIMGDIEILKFIIRLDKKYLLSIPDYDGNYPIHHAVMGGYKYILDYLIFCEVDITVKNRDGYTSDQLAIINDEPDLVVDKNSYDNLDFAVSKDSMYCISNLLEKLWKGRLMYLVKYEFLSKLKL